MKKALITGITGQDGAYLARFLLKKGYEVHGIIRRSSSFNTGRIDDIYQDPHIYNRTLFLHYGDLSDSSTLNKLLRKVMPDEVYNLGAQSHVKVSFDLPEYTSNITFMGTTRLLEGIKNIKQDSKKDIKFYQASSSEMYGAAKDFPQNETSLFNPVSPYAIAKLSSHHLTKMYRDAYNIFACSGILFNHESPLRGGTFVTKKITQAAAKIKKGKQDKLYLGNLDAKRDWGYAPEYVEMMWMMLQHDIPDDYVIATGESHTVREFVEEAFNLVGMQIRWQGSGLEEKGLVNSKVVVVIDPKYYRPCEANHLQGDYSKAKKILGWEPKTKFKELVKIMVDHDLKQIENGILER